MEKESKLFDKRFVHFIWDDELEGKECFLEDNIDDLRYAVERKHGGLHVKVHSGKSSSPFDDGNSWWRFAYYDPNYEVKWAFYKEGKKVQVGDYIGNWADCHGEPHWSDNCKYRIKPECPCEEGIDSKACVGCPEDEWRKHSFRPYTETAEMIYDFTNRFPAVYPRSSVCEPMIWLKKKNSVNDGRKLVVCFTNSWVLLIDSKKLFMNELLEEYTYLDGSPVGMEVKE